MIEDLSKDPLLRDVPEFFRQRLPVCDARPSRTVQPWKRPGLPACKDLGSESLEESNQLLAVSGQLRKTEEKGKKSLFSQS